jgi:hypothetical protein
MSADPVFTPNQKKILMSLASRKGVAGVDSLVHDSGLSLIDAYRVLVSLERDKLVSHSGVDAECREVTRRFKKWQLDEQVPKAKGVAFCLTIDGIRATQSLVKQAFKASP